MINTTIQQYYLCSVFLHCVVSPMTTIFHFVLAIVLFTFAFAQQQGQQSQPALLGSLDVINTCHQKDIANSY